jgi:hypothetical protein
MPPSTSVQVSLFNPIFPDTKTNPLALMACENTGIGAGALGVRTSVMELMLSFNFQKLSHKPWQELLEISLQYMLLHG